MAVKPADKISTKPTADLTANLKAGQDIVCTVTSRPGTPSQLSTLERLMRRDAGVKRGLRKAQRQRRQGMIVYNRGNRDWYKRSKCSAIVRPAPGQTWTMKYTLDLAHDFAAVKGLVSVKAK